MTETRQTNIYDILGTDGDETSDDSERRELLASPNPLGGLKVYLSGPMTGRPDKNSVAFAAAEKVTYELGAADVYNPVTHTKSVDWTEREQFLRYDLGVLLGCDIMVQIADWSQSVGALTELTTASACGIDVIELKTLVTWARSYGNGEPDACDACGRRATVVHDGDEKSALDGSCMWHVMCDGCGAVGPEMMTRRDAIEAWNSGCRVCR